MIVAGKYTDWWAYTLAPLVGGVAALTFYLGALRPAIAPA
jgi:hypothetical protein